MAVEAMNKRLISRLMHERVSGLRSSGVYFFRPDFEYILRGVVLEYVPRGLYIWNFRFPLFDFFGPNLGYSDRLPGGDFIGKGEMSEEAIVDFVMASPEARHAFGDAPMDLPEFVRYLQESDCLLNPHAQLIYAAALVLLGQGERAVDMLEEILPTLHPSDIPHLNQLMSSLQEGPEAARKLLDEIRQENLRAFGLI
jgi:hypothetical protein